MEVNSKGNDICKLDRMNISRSKNSLQSLGESLVCDLLQEINDKLDDLSDNKFMMLPDESKCGVSHKSNILLCNAHLDTFDYIFQS